MATKLNTALLSQMIKNKRGDTGLRTVAKEIGGVSASTLSRIEKGKLPDVDTFLRICNWLVVPSDTFALTSRSPGDVPTKLTAEPVIVNIQAHLRAEQELDPSTVNTIVKMINLAAHNES